MVGETERIKEKLRGVIDPETGMSVVDMGMIEEIVVEGNRARIAFRPTIPGCPLIHYLAQRIKSATETVVKEAEVEVRT